MFRHRALKGLKGKCLLVDASRHFALYPDPRREPRDIPEPKPSPERRARGYLTRPPPVMLFILLLRIASFVLFPMTIGMVLAKGSVLVAGAVGGGFWAVGSALPPSFLGTVTILSWTVSVFCLWVALGASPPSGWFGRILSQEENPLTIEGKKAGSVVHGSAGDIGQSPENVSKVSLSVSSVVLGPLGAPSQGTSLVLDPSAAVSPKPTSGGGRLMPGTPLPKSLRRTPKTLWGGFRWLKREGPHPRPRVSRPMTTTPRADARSGNPWAWKSTPGAW